jgi:hypothetical protein
MVLCLPLRLRVATASITTYNLHYHSLGFKVSVVALLLKEFANKSVIRLLLSIGNLVGTTE